MSDAREISLGKTFVKSVDTAFGISTPAQSKVTFGNGLSANITHAAAREIEAEAMAGAFDYEIVIRKVRR